MWNNEGGDDMATLAQALKQLIDNPDDLTALPGIIEQVSTLENDVDTYQSKIVEMRDLNKKYLSMVPITNEDPTDTTPVEEPPATLNDARSYLVDSLTNKGE